MSSLGQHLRGLREARGAPLDDIARFTRVGRRHLEALESDNLGELPAPVFVTGFIRAYCEFLDAEPDEAVRLYLDAVGTAVKPERAQSVPRTSPPRRAGLLLVSLALFVALGLSLFVLRIGLKSPPSQGAAVSGPARSARESLPLEAPALAKASPAFPAPAVSAPAAGPQSVGQRLLVRAVETTWMRVQVDEGQVTEELLPAGAVREWTAARRFVIAVSNAGGLEVDLNGRRIPPLGSKGAIIQRLVLPSEGSGGGS